MFVGYLWKFVGRENKYFFVFVEYSYVIVGNFIYSCCFDIFGNV